MDDNIVGEIVIDQGCWRLWRSTEGIRDLVGLASNMPDVAGELADEQEVTLGPQGPSGSGVGLGDRAGQGLVISVCYHLPPLDEVLELPDRGGNGQELAVQGGVPGLGVGESTAEEGERLKPLSMVLMENPADGEVGGVGGDGQGGVKW